jgi:hypothetical protein
MRGYRYAQVFPRHQNLGTGRIRLKDAAGRTKDATLRVGKGQGVNCSARGRVDGGEIGVVTCRAATWSPLPKMSEAAIELRRAPLHSGWGSNTAGTGPAGYRPVESMTYIVVTRRSRFVAPKDVVAGNRDVAAAAWRLPASPLEQ